MLFKEWVIRDDSCRRKMTKKIGNERLLCPTVLRSQKICRLKRRSPHIDELISIESFEGNNARQRENVEDAINNIAWHDTRFVTMAAGRHVTAAPIFVHRLTAPVVTAAAQT